MNLNLDKLRCMVRHVSAGVVNICSLDCAVSSRRVQSLGQLWAVHPPGILILLHMASNTGLLSTNMAARFQKRLISTSEGRNYKFQSEAQRLHSIACVAKSDRLLREEIEFCLNRRKDTKIYSNCHPGAGRRCSVSGVKLSQPPVN